MWWFVRGGRRKPGGCKNERRRAWVGGKQNVEDDLGVYSCVFCDSGLSYLGKAQFPWLLLLRQVLLFWSSLWAPLPLSSGPTLIWSCNLHPSSAGSLNLLAEMLLLALTHSPQPLEGPGDVRTKALPGTPAMQFCAKCNLKQYFCPVRC